MIDLDETHDVSLISWVTSANDPATDFPIQNLPFSSFRRCGSDENFRGGVAIGEQILDLAAVSKTSAIAGALSGSVQEALEACSLPTLNRFMSMGNLTSRALRLALSRVLRSDFELQGALQSCLIPQSEAEYQLPCHIGDFTDFYASIHHATNAGKLFRPDAPLLPNYKWIPIAYHGRSSSIGISGQQVHRPQGQSFSGGAEPCFGPSQRLDYELEMGIFVGQGNQRGQAIAVEQAEEHVFGLCLLNDWSARDIQSWEYKPLGPFLAKNFASTISPWIVTMEALSPFRVALERDSTDPQPLSYLNSAANSAAGAFDITLQCSLSTELSRATSQPETLLSTTSFRHCYWSVAQMLAHHTVNGCNLQSGDLLGSGTQSDPNPDQAGCLLELTRGGQQPLSLDNGEKRSFLADGDTVIMRGYCEREGARRIGFGEVCSTVLPVSE